MATVNEKMTAIADAIRAKTGGTEPLTLDGMATAIPIVYKAGEDARQQLIDKDIYIGTSYGNGQKDITIDMPILPDVLCIFSFDTTVQRLDSRWTVALYDRRAFGDIVGTVRYYLKSSENYGAGAQVASTAQKMYVFDTENNKMIFTAPSTTTYQKQVWSAETPYFVFAFRYAGNKTDKQLLEEIVARLDNSTGGTYIFSKHRINQTVTDAEWNELIAIKPNLTFVLY